MIRSRRNYRPGITLLEIVLALTLAAIAMALLTQLVGIGNRAASVARDSAKAQLVAQSIMAEVMSGITPTQSGSGTYEQDPSWSYELMVSPGPSENIDVIRVSVFQLGQENPLTFALTQWQAIPPLLEEETTDDTSGDAR